MHTSSAFTVICLGALVASSSSAATPPASAWLPRPRCGTPTIARLEARTARPRPPAPREPHTCPPTLRDAIGELRLTVPLGALRPQGRPGHRDLRGAGTVRPGDAGACLGPPGQRDELPPPPGADTYYINVYVGSSGGGAPGTLGFLGYKSDDSEGQPFIVFNAVAADGDPLEGTLTHEFFHAVQESLGMDTDYNVAGWYWEAMGEWLEWRRFPDWGATYIDYFLELPQVSLDFLDYPDTGDLIEYHQYGAALFLAYLTNLTDWNVIRDSWTHATDVDYPLRSLDALLAARGSRFAGS